MPNVNLSDAEWQQVMNILGDVPWKIAHPLLMKIGQQVQAQQQGAGNILDPTKQSRLNADGKEVRHE